MESVDCVVALVWKLPEWETEKVGRNKISTLVHKLDPETSAGFHTSFAECLPQCGPGPAVKTTVYRETGEGAALEGKPCA